MIEEGLQTSPTLLNAKKSVPAMTSMSPRRGFEPPTRSMVSVLYEYITIPIQLGLLIFCFGSFLKSFQWFVFFRFKSVPCVEDLVSKRK